MATMGNKKSKINDPDWVPTEDDHDESSDVNASNSTAQNVVRPQKSKKPGISLVKAGKDELEKVGIRAEIAEALAQQSSQGKLKRLSEVVNILEHCGASCQVKFDGNFEIEMDTAGGLSLCMQPQESGASSPPTKKKKKRREPDWKPDDDQSDSDDDDGQTVQTEQNDADKLDVNAATEEELEALKGIGPGLARKIIAYRKKHGFFRRIEDLAAIKGISVRKIKEHLASQIKVEESADSKPLTTSLNPVAPNKSLLFGKREVVRLISWNLQCFSDEKSENDGVIEVICRTILENGISLAVFQEIADETAVNRIKDELNNPTIKGLKKLKTHQGNWQCVYSDVAGPMFRSREYNAFIFDASRGIQLKSHDLIEKPIKGKKQFTRRPFLGFFKAAGLDFIVVSVHLKATGLANEDISKLQEELVHIPDVISAIEDRIPGEKDMIILGDFNLEPDGDEFDSFRDAGLSNLIANTQYTNISTCNMDGSKCYDNIWISTHTKTYYSTGRAGVIREGMSHRLIPAGWRMNGVISDHCPVWGEFYCDRDMDKSSGKEDVEDIVVQIKK